MLVFSFGRRLDRHRIASGFLEGRRSIGSGATRTRVVRGSEVQAVECITGCIRKLEPFLYSFKYTEPMRTSMS